MENSKSLTRKGLLRAKGSNFSDFSGQISVFWTGGRLREVVAPEGSNVGILMHVLSLVQCKQVGQG